MPKTYEVYSPPSDSRCFKDGDPVQADSLNDARRVAMNIILCDSSVTVYVFDQDNSDTYQEMIYYNGRDKRYHQNGIKGRGIIYRSGQFRRNRYAQGDTIIRGTRSIVDRLCDDIPAFVVVFVAFRKKEMMSETIFKTTSITRYGKTA